MADGAQRVALVGALSQFLLVPGQLAFIRTRCRVRRYRRLLRTEVALWNRGMGTGLGMAFPWQ